MASRSMPGLGLRAFWNLGEDAWNGDPGMDGNLRKLSALTQLNVLNRILAASLPGSPTHGMIYIVTDGANANNIALYDTDTWIYLEPAEGWRAYDVAAGKFVYFNGTAWVDEVDLTGISTDEVWVPVGVLTGTGVSILAATDLPDGCVDFAVVGTVLKSSNTATVLLQISDDNGATYKTSLNYRGPGGGTTSAALIPSDSSTSLARNYNIDVRITALTEPKATVIRSSWAIDVGNPSNNVLGDTAYTRNVSEVCNAFKIFPSAGTVDADLRVYGRKGVA